MQIPELETRNSTLETQNAALAWAARWPVCAATTDHGLDHTHVPHGGFRTRLLVAHKPALQLRAAPGALARLRRYLTRPWAGGPRALLISYDFKNALDPRLVSRHPDPLSWPLLTVLEPALWIDFQGEAMTIGGVNATEATRIEAEIRATPVPHPAAPVGVTLTPRMPRTAYLHAAEVVREDIRQGEVYELNLCQEFYTEHAKIPDPVGTFLALGQRSPTPFGGFWRVGSRYLLQASPERFCRLDGRILRSQPIKGTAPRSLTPAEDETNRLALLADEKERAENLMIVDLVRNDLSRAGCLTGSVQVEELFGTYGFRHVWQMISTVRGELPPGAGLYETLTGLFPMGSMTGAPKRRATELIDTYETSRRGLYSGAVGWLEPTGDFDLSVVIRSLQYRADTGYVSFQVGSALTYDADPAREYDECLLKARALREVVDG